MKEYLVFHTVDPTDTVKLELVTDISNRSTNMMQSEI
jgi:hypothetical protein